MDGFREQPSGDPMCVSDLFANFILFSNRDVNMNDNTDPRKRRIDDDETDDEEEQRRDDSTVGGRIRNWGSCILWIVVAYFTMKQTDMVGVLLHSNLINRLCLHVSFLLLFLTFAVAVYLTAFVEVKDYETALLPIYKTPRAIPVATATWVSGSTFFAIAVWPVFHLLTFPIMFVLFIGFVNIISLVPGGKVKKT
eukprot:TRINITY_DN7623_c0_g1_i1.p1 TRINITY_DN7623_c0_g1~~TRINITY_DN7623_c0_g1_i1.p1  ORF type:complete len:217 (+),score=29.68 TRINITY_DN7623_c0_g1_i1:67-651(+)